MGQTDYDALTVSRRVPWECFEKRPAFKGRGRRRGPSYCRGLRRRLAFASSAAGPKGGGRADGPKADVPAKGGRREDGRESRTAVAKQAVVASSQLRPIRQGLKAGCTRLLGVYHSIACCSPMGEQGSTSWLLSIKPKGFGCWFCAVGRG